MSEHPLDEHIDRYPLLGPEERAELEAYVRAHPEWAPRLREAQALTRLLEEARRLHGGGAVDDEALATYLVHRHADPGERAPPLREAFARVEAQLAAQPELRARAEAMRRRLEELETASDPFAQFERLTGHRLETDADEPAPADTGRPSTRRADRAPRQPARIHRLHRPMRWAAAALLAGAALYVVLLLTGRALQPEWERLAVIEPGSVETYGTLRLRGITDLATDTTSVDQLFVGAVELLEDAYRAPLGLFPFFDEERVARAAAMLEEVIEREPPESFVRLEAYYFLGKARLAQGRFEAARTALQQVADGRGPRAGEAERLIAELRQRDGRD